MSDLSESSSAGLSDWALVNSQGELEGSDVESSNSSAEVIGQKEEAVGHNNPVSRNTPPECIELEQLMRKADAAVTVTEKETPSMSEPAESRQLSPEANGNEISQIHAVSASEEAESQTCVPSQLACYGNDVASLQEDLEQSSQKVDTLGACCSELLQSWESKQFVENEQEGKGIKKVSQEKEGSPTLPLFHGDDSPVSSSSLSSLSGLSSLSSTSKRNRTDSDSDSDFVRLEKESSNISTESEGEQALPLMRINTLTTSGSSIGSGFNFFPDTRDDIRPLSSLSCSSSSPMHQHQPPQQPQPLPLVEQASVQGDGPLPQQQRQEERPSPPQEEQPEEVEEERPPMPLPWPQPLYHRHQVEAAAMAYDADDGDTESSTEEQDQDDRIESEQSDDAHSAQADDLDQGDLSALNDIGDLPVELGAVERHYIHYNNQQLNGRLNTVVLAVLVLALGMGLGHWIGSTREHFSQLEIQLAQVKRLHQMQDEYMQCLARNDELQLDYDNFLQGERNRHQEAMLDLRDNNRELQEQLQEAQDQLEQLLIATARKARSIQRKPEESFDSQSSHLTSQNLQDILTLSKLLIASEKEFHDNTASWDTESQQMLLEERASFSKVIEEKQAEQNSHWQNELQQAVAKGDHLTSLLQRAFRLVSSLQSERNELKILVGKLRYSASGPDEFSLPSPCPKPVPAPPLAAEDVGQISAEVLKEEAIVGEEKDPKQLSLLDHEGDYVNSGSDRLDVMQQLLEESESSLANGGDMNDVSVVQKMAATKGKQDSQDAEAVAKVSYHKAECNTETPQPVPVDVNLLQRDFILERERAKVWRNLYLSAQEENQQPLNASACLQYLSQQMNLSNLMHYILSWNLTKDGVKDFVDTTQLVSGIVKLHQNLAQALPSLWEELSSTLYHFHKNSTASSSQDSEKRSQEDDGRGEGQGQTREEQDEIKKSKWSDGVKIFLNKTRGTLSNVSRQLQKTWRQVKNVSHHLWSSDDSIIGRMASRVKRTVTTLSDKVHKKASRWFHKRFRGDKHGKEDQDEPDSQKHGSEQEKELGSADKTDKDSVNKLENKKKSDKHLASKKGAHSQYKDGMAAEDKLGKGAHKDSQAKMGKKKMTSKPVTEKEWKKQKDSHGKYDKQKKKFDKHMHKNSLHKMRRKEENLDKHKKKSVHRNSGKWEERSSSYPQEDGKKERKFNEQQKNYHQKGEKKVKNFGSLQQEDSPRSQHKKEGRFGKQKWKDVHHRVLTAREDVDFEMHRSKGSEPERTFHSKGQHRSFPSGKDARARYTKLEKQFQRQFNKISSMDKASFHCLNSEDCLQIFQDIQEVFRMYSDNSETGLPRDTPHWLKCQLLWWINAQPRGMYYQPTEGCLQYLVPWQQDLLDDLQSKLKSGECHTLPKLSDRDPAVPSIACDGEINVRLDHSSDECDQHRNSWQKFRKGKKENGIGLKDTSIEALKMSKDGQQINDTAEESNAWYFHWVKGRDDLRTLEHRADWMFERAMDRAEIRQAEHSADWIFERAAYRDNNRDSYPQKGDKDYSKILQDGRRVKQPYHDRTGQWHKKKEGGFKRQERDYRQKYGSTSFCEFC